MDSLRSELFRLFWHALILLSLVVGSGCGHDVAKLNGLEGSAAGVIQKFLALYEAEHPTVQITNLAQVFDATMDLNRWHRTHPAFFELEFRKFGEYAGFTNSFYERYVRVPSFVTNQTFPTNPIFMNAQPFPDQEGRKRRYVIWRGGPLDFRTSLVFEEQIEEAFRRADVAIPKPTPMAKPPVPAGSPYHKAQLSVRIRWFFRDLVGPAFADELMWICFSLPVAAAAVVVVWLSRRRSCQ